MALPLSYTPSEFSLEIELQPRVYILYTFKKNQFLNLYCRKYKVVNLILLHFSPLNFPTKIQRTKRPVTILYKCIIDLILLHFFPLNFPAKI